MDENLECGGFVFINNFDSANLAKVEQVEVKKVDNAKSEQNRTEIKNENNKNENNKSLKHSTFSEPPLYEFNIWSKPDCDGTEYQNNNKTWFHFGVKAPVQGACVKINIVNLNKQVKMFSQGMSPVYKIVPGHPHWDRIKEKPTFIADDKNNEFILSFNYHTPDNPNAVTYFAFTYPFSYTELQNFLKKLDAKMAKQSKTFPDDIYYHRDCAIYSLEGRRLDVLTISSFFNILPEHENNMKDLFPDPKDKRPLKFHNKKVVFLSARVHPGETPSSFVLNGFINFLLNREDQIAIALRRQYVFKLIPMLNPDGVAQGYYRMDTKGINLNRLYLNPLKKEHPTIFAAKALLRYYHNSYMLQADQVPQEQSKSIATNTVSPYPFNTNDIYSKLKETNKLLQRVTQMSAEEKNKYIEHGSRARNSLIQASEKTLANKVVLENKSNSLDPDESCNQIPSNRENSGIFLYIDFHGHASKKGIFMYGNHFDDPTDASNCLLLPKLMSLNNPNFHFTSCNFAEKNMYCVDKRDGMSREGSGRVAVFKLTGLINSYTLECNYNTGRLVNCVPARVKDGIGKSINRLYVPPKYNPVVFEEVGAALGPSILDMTGTNPNSRIPNSQYRSLKGLKEYLRLISSHHYNESALSKPLNKRNCSFPNRYCQDSSDPSDNTPNLPNQSSLEPKKKKKKTLRKIAQSKSNKLRDGKAMGSNFVSTHIQIKSKPIHSKSKESLLNKKKSKNKSKENVSKKKKILKLPTKAIVSVKSKIMTRVKKKEVVEKRIKKFSTSLRVTRQLKHNSAFKGEKLKVTNFLRSTLNTAANKKSIKKSEKPKRLKKL